MRGVIVSNCYILLNGVQNVRIFFPDISGSYETGTVSGVLRLKHGDRVNVGECDMFNSLLTDNTINTFSGLLVRADR